MLRPSVEGHFDPRHQPQVNLHLALHRPRLRGGLQLRGPGLGRGLDVELVPELLGAHRGEAFELEAGQVGGAVLPAPGQLADVESCDVIWTPGIIQTFLCLFGDIYFSH